MNKFPWQKAALIIIGAAVVVTGVLYFKKAKSSDMGYASVDPAFGEYISSYTAGVVNSSSAIRIVLATEAVDSASLGETSVSLFDLSPSIKGTTVWLDRRTVEFRPALRMASGQTYQAEFALSKLVDVPAKLGAFKFSFQVIPQNFELIVDNIKPYVKTELKRQKIEGTLQTADFAESEAIEKTLSAQQDGKSLKVSWTHAGEGKQHSFVIEDVARKDQATEVKIAVNGQSIGIDQTDARDVEIPALGDFRVMNVKVEQSSSQHVVVQFSDPIAERQNLDGLVSISEIPSLDFEIKDNEIRIFPPARQTGQKTLTIEAGVKNILNYRMAQGGTFEVVFEQVAPSVRFVGKGNILPSTDGLILPFEAVNLKAVDIQIVKIYENNVLQFLQVNDFDGNEELRRVGKPLIKKMVSLENSGVNDLGKWNRFTLDLAQYISTEPGAIYQVKISFKRQYSVYNCPEGETQPESPITDENWDDQGNDESAWDSYEEYYYNEDYDWEQRDNPCHSSYYTGNRAVTRNVIASDLGLMAKRGGDGNTVIFVNDLKTTEPLTGVQIELYDFQQQVIGNASTGSDGKAIISAKQTPYVLVAKNGAQRGFLKLQGGESLSLSNFDVGGEYVSNGLKGLIYGERGVWRPGDSLYITFLLEDKLKLIPAAHPVVMELQNPQGQVTQRLVRSSSENGFYKFATATASDAPTGNWTARVKVGGAQFTQTVKIETVKPNRLKINLDFGKDKISAGDNNVSGTLQVNWLAGSPGRNLKAEFEVLLTPAETKFAKYPEYTFDDPSKNIFSEAKSIFEGYTNDDGRANINASVDVEGDPAGMLNAVFRGKVFEESGNFSVDRFSLPFYPYTSFTGIRLPQGDKARGMLLTDTTHRVDVVTLDADGNGVSSNSVEMSITKLEWRWWWDNSGDNANYMSATNTTPIASGNIKTVDGKGSWTFKVKYPEWGRYLVRAKDLNSGHSTAKVVYIDWPGWAGRARNESQGAAMLSFSSDKPAYNIGEKANLTIPGSDNGRALISVENGSRVLDSYWLNTQKGDNKFSFDIKPEMTPNVFVSVTLLQPHAQTVNDLPIRMYGVIPLSVEDPQTHLNPVISMPDVLEPGEEVVIKISEQSKRKMTYTVAMVDEGLLDLTRFKTPDAWSRFYAREALGVRTWDIYDAVMGAFGGKIERLLAIGGDMEMMAKSKEDDAKANRFKPVVKFLGPFTLDGGTAEHKFIMPQYVGSVKTMVVAGYEGAYGKTDKATPVRKPLMVLATLPRVLGPEETLKLLVTLFSMEKNIRNVKVDVKVSGPVSLSGDGSRSVAMDKEDMTVDFDLAVKSETGIAKIEVTATSGNYKATDVIEIEIRNPNPPVTKVVDALLESNKNWSGTVTAVGVAGTNVGSLEISSLPPINLGQRLRYLMQYPHGCIEQTTSSVFPQLYLDQVKALSDEERAVIQRNVRAGIERLKLFVTSDGGFAYWPGNQDSDSWGSTYAGHFLLEADAKGYFVPNDMIKRWKKYQRAKSVEWRKNKEYQSSELIQAYRLYTLALAGDADLASMNRLREMGNLPVVSAWMLAAAYVKAGQPEAAKTLIANLPFKVKPYQEMAYSYGSDDRDKAIILETMLLLNDRTRAFDLVKEISATLSNSNTWLSTQAVAWCLKSVGMFAGNEKKGPLKFSYTYNGKNVPVSTDLPMAQVPLPFNGMKGGELKIESQTQGTLFVRVITEGIPARGMEEAASNNMSIAVSYTDSDGNALDPSNLEQGQEFIASVSITNPGSSVGAYKNLSLNQIFPSGWEINNLRLDEAEERLSSDKATYQDIRDDRVYTYFDLGTGQRKTFKVMLTATYAGSYYLPAVSCEAMYDHGIYARTKGQVVEVRKRVVQ